MLLSKESAKLLALRTSCPSSFMCQYHLFCPCFPMLYVNVSYSVPTDYLFLGNLLQFKGEM